MPGLIPSLVVFDMAGTTIDTGAHVARAFKKAFAERGIALSEPEIAAARGKSKTEAVRELLAGHAGTQPQPSEVQAIFSDFRRRLLLTYDEEGVSAIAGVREAFEWLRSKGAQVALTTGFDRALAERLARMAGFGEAADALVAGDEVERGRPAPDLVLEAMRRTGIHDSARVAVVGDTVSDLEAANAAGAGWSIGVLSGAHDRARLECVPHTAILDSVADLPGYFMA